MFKLDDAERQENWLQSRLGQSAFALETEVLRKVWKPVSPQRVLEVGCGSGTFLEWFVSQGHMATGIEPSSSSLELARRRLGGRVGLDQGFAENLPYEDNEFDTVALITTLEFVDDPFLALKEAVRVARRNVLVGALNRYSAGRMQYLLEKLWKDPPYDRARYFSVFQLRRMAGRIFSGSVPIEWRTCISFPLPLLRYLGLLERSPLIQRNPFGHFIAMRIDMLCRFRTLQTPVFTELPTGAGAGASVRPLFWRSGDPSADLCRRSSGLREISSGT
ncbi:MAG: class I SAM-dependent methyltransferase [Desulfobacteraceae bacterium]|nr:class I SAM-dependent methyltransferase [Desulfobacteraceae bacterium]